MRDKIQEHGSLENFIDPEAKTIFLAELAETVEWLYGEGETAKLQEYIEKYEKYRSIGDPIKERHQFYESLAEL